MAPETLRWGWWGCSQPCTVWWLCKVIDPWSWGCNTKPEDERAETAGQWGFMMVFNSTALGNQLIPWKCSSASPNRSKVEEKLVLSSSRDNNSDGFWMFLVFSSMCLLVVHLHLLVCTAAVRLTDPVGVRRQWWVEGQPDTRHTSSLAVYNTWRVFKSSGSLSLSWLPSNHCVDVCFPFVLEASRS